MRFWHALSGLARTIIGWAVFVLVVLLLEVTAFNYQHWQTADLEPQTIIQDGEYVDGGRAWSTPVMQTAGSTGVGVLFKQPTQVSTLRVDAERPVKVEVSLSDDGFQDQVYRLRHDVYPSIPATQTFCVYPYGDVLLMKVAAIEPLDSFSLAEGEEPKLSEVQINAPIPFEFSWLRVASLLCLGLLIWGFAARRRIFRTAVFQNTGAKGEGTVTASRSARVVLYAASVTVSLILCAGMFVFPDALGYFGPKQTVTETSETTEAAQDDPEANTETEDSSGSPLEYHYYSVYEGQYAELAKSFLSGRLDLDVEPLPGLKNATNPYDMTERITLEETYGTSIYQNWDMAYYHGKFYVYFGVLPVLLFYVPWQLLTGQALPTYFAIALMLVVTSLGICSLLLQLARRFFPEVSLGVMMLCVAIVPLSSMLAWCAMNASIYSLPVLCGLACLAWGASLYARLDRHPWLVIPGSLLCALIFACRPQVAAFCVLLIPFGVMALRTQNTRTDRAAYLAAALTPFAVVLVLLGLYNAARFGSPFDLGANYNLTTNDMRLRPWMPDAGLAGLYYLIVQPPVIDPTFPYFTDTELSYEYPAYLVYETCIGGVIWLAPVLWFLCALLPKGTAENPLPGRAWCWRLMVGAAVGLALLITIFDALAAGILPRYVTDFMLPLSVLAALGLMRAANVSADAKPVATSAVQPEVAPAEGELAASVPAVRPWVVRCATACLIVALVVSVAVDFYSWARYKSDRNLEMQEITARVDTQLFG